MEPVYSESQKRRSPFLFGRSKSESSLYDDGDEPSAQLLRHSFDDYRILAEASDLDNDNGSWVSDESEASAIDDVSDESDSDGDGHAAARSGFQQLVDTPAGDLLSRGERRRLRRLVGPGLLARRLQHPARSATAQRVGQQLEKALEKTREGRKAKAERLDRRVVARLAQTTNEGLGVDAFAAHAAELRAREGIQATKLEIGDEHLRKQAQHKDVKRHTEQHAAKLRQEYLDDMQRELERRKKGH